ncbi:MAG: M23 family metallopeptidase, partial [Caldilinea sp.]
MNDPDIDPETAAWLAEEADPAARAAADQASRPTWWRKTVDARNLPGRKVKIMEDGTVTSVVLDATGKHRYGNHVLISHCTGTPNTIFAHLHKINVSVGQRVKAGTVIGEGEPPLLLPAEFAATTAAVRDCKIKRFTPEGRPIEGWIVPVNYQLAGIHQRIHVMHEGKVLPRDAQRRLNGGECWEYIAVTSAPIANLPKLEPQPFKKNAIVRPPLHERIAAYDAPMPKLPAHRCFNPGDPAWHEPLRDDDTHHLIVTLNDSEHALAKLVADLIA